MGFLTFASLSDRHSYLQNHTLFKKYSFKQVYVTIVIISIIIYGTLLGGQNVWYDESYTFAMLPHSFSDIWKITAADVHPPLYYFFVKILTAPFGYSLISAKIVSIIPFLFIIIFGGYQINKFFGKENAVYFMLFFLLFPFLMKYSIEIRMYSLAAALVFGNAIFAYRCYIEDKKINWLFFSLFGVCSAYTHYFSLVSTGIVYLILFIFIIKDKRKLLLWTVASAFTIILYLPWMSSFIEQLIIKVNNEYWIDDITIGALIGYVWTVFGGALGKNGAILLFFAYFVTLIQIIRQNNRSDILFSIVLLSVPVGTVFIGVMASILIRPVFIIRYVVPALPLLILFLTFNLSRCKSKPIKVYAITVSIILGIIGYGTTMCSEYTVMSNDLDGGFVEQYSYVDSYVVQTTSVHVSGILSYYDTDKPIYTSGETTVDNPACPYENLFSYNLFNSKQNDKIICLLNIGERPSEELLSDYKTEYIGEIGNLADAYLLTK